MKRISIFLIACLLLITPTLLAQDAAAAAAKAEREAEEERYKRLNSAVDDLLVVKMEQDKRIAALAREVESLREQVSKPSGDHASREELSKLAGKVQEIDKKREEDKELILKKIGELGKTLSTPNARHRAAVTDSPPADPADRGKGYEYEIQSGDTLSVIVQAYRVKNIKVTVDQILKANPKLEPTKLRVGQKIWIPSPDKP